MQFFPLGMADFRVLREKACQRRRPGFLSADNQEVDSKWFLHGIS